MYMLLACCVVALLLLPSAATCPALVTALEQSKTTNAEFPVWVHCTFNSWTEWSRATKQTSQIRDGPNARIALTTTVVGGSTNVQHLPSLIIGGVQKSGTTHLRHLLHMQSIFSAGTAPDLEVHFFDHLKNYGSLSRDLQARAYSNYLPLAKTTKGGIFTEDFNVYQKRREEKKPMYFIDTTPAYITFDFVARSINRMLPFVRMLFLLRDPVERYKSHLIMEVETRLHLYSGNPCDPTYGPFKPVARGYHPKGRYAYAFSSQHSVTWFHRPGEMKEYITEMNQKQGGRGRSPLGRGDYITPLKKWLEIFGEDRIMIIAFEYLKNQEKQVVKDIARFVGFGGTLNVVDSAHLQEKNSRVGMACPNVLNIFTQRDKCHLSNYYAKANAGLAQLLGRPEEDFPWLARGSNQDCDALPA